MSAQSPVPHKRITAPEIAARKGGEPTKMEELALVAP